jgi:hypothetical protein
MSHTCTKCSRVNPEEAVYCYFDGIPLNGLGRAGGPIAVGAQPFPNPFVFPSGRTCRSFDELAIACNEEWAAARELLREGFLGSFFVGLGRPDLARAADEARRFPDPDRGFNQLLAKLPTDVLVESSVRAQPQSVNLGTIPVGENRRFDLHLENTGMRLAYGTITVENCPWLMLGDAPGAVQKLFQFFHETTVPVHVIGKQLPASRKLLEGKLTVESSSGESLTVVVRAEVPVTPFPGTSLLAGARSPRQVAEKAKDKPKEAAVLFENGEVAAWYKSNGWTYPVQGPAASGLGAVQQFFEALGLTPPPRIQLKDKEVTFQGNVRDDHLRFTLEVFTEERKPIYAHAVSDQPWLEISRVKLKGRSAHLTLRVPSVPNRPGETLLARVKIQSNGNQKFVVPVTLHIAHNFDFTAPAPPPPPPPPPPAPDPLPLDIPELIEEAPAALPVAVTLSAPPPPPRPAPVPAPVRVPVLAAPPQRSRGKPNWAHAVPAGLLALALLVVVIVDLASRGRRGEEEGASEPPTPAAAESRKDFFALIREAPSQSLLIDFNDQRRFGLTVKGEGAAKRLTFDPKGDTNNTIIRLNDPESTESDPYYNLYFGREPPFKWVKGESLQVLVLSKENEPRGWKSRMRFKNDLDISQYVLLVPSQSGALDTCLVYYEIKNISKSRTHKVGIRFLLDTYIGGNDGVPFTIPGPKKFANSKDEFLGAQVPDFVEAVEKPDDPKDPGTVARLVLKGVQVPEIGKLDEVNRLVLCRYPGNQQANWAWPFESMATPTAEGIKDSCAVLYWDDKELASNGGTRYVGFTYGLGTLEGSSDEVKAVALSVPGTAYVEAPFYVTAYVYGGTKGQKVRLSLPEGLDLLESEAVEKNVEETASRTAVFWKVRAVQPGIFEGIVAEWEKRKSKPAKVVVKKKSIFG